jgi:hypothetical protein
MTGLCQRPIVHNRTCSVIPGAYWTVTRCCLHRVRSCDHRVRSSREERISPFLTVRSDLVRFLFRLYPPPTSPRSRAPPPRLATAPLQPCRALAPAPAAVPSTPCSRRASAPCLRAREPATRSPAPPRHRSHPASPSHAPLRPSTTAVSLNSLPYVRHRSKVRTRYHEDLTLGTRTLALQRIVLRRSIFREVFVSANISVSAR